MFQTVAILIVVVGTFAIFYTIVGAVSGRSMTIALILAGSILALQAVSLVFSAVTDPPTARPSPTESAEPSAEPAPSASVSLAIG